MGRPENPVDRTVPARAQLADFLRERRSAAGLTYSQMAKVVGGQPSAATFERAASGTIVPSLETIRDFIIATTTEKESFGPGPALARGRELWIQVRRATRAPYYVCKAPDPTLVSDTAGFLRALRHQHVWMGYPTPGVMERMSGPGMLPRTTTRRIIDGDTLPVDPQQAVAFLKACYVIDETELGLWLAAAVRSFRNDPARSKNIGKWVNAHQEMIQQAKSKELATVTTLHDEEGKKAA
ncbi:transcriptional regulator with XRE-family HTH domain [Streptomyces nodosus]|uniref:helix-turn-helix domain-containing protein n=1 Tax=Streptomyces nodosus TaxID=40318 RepID=UPI00161D660F|nr:helix-turn-helix transcriptional regulator [Streptomyces nodosus]MBB4796286.1 transcriptional regulator with XRE-family HTH domain [Streptomyces nodosus]